MNNRPSHSLALHHFNTINQGRDKGYNFEHVANTIGGKVKDNINGRIFKNLCAVRMSYVLNQCGITISSADGETSGGKDGKRYLFRVLDLHRFLTRKFGQPDLTDSSKSHSALIGKKGIIIFEASFTGATGHATLWRVKSATDCSDNCYFHESKKVYLWELP